MTSSPNSFNYLTYVFSMAPTAQTWTMNSKGSGVDDEATPSAAVARPKVTRLHHDPRSAMLPMKGFVVSDSRAEHFGVAGTGVRK